jgi:succinylarginine dihydrolase
MATVCFDGIVGPTHGHAGLSAGNLAATRHAGEIANPRAAALEGIAKMRFVAKLGVRQAVLPPQPRPELDALRRLGFSGDDRAVLEAAARVDGGRLLALVSSASAMWTANAATVAPSSDTADGRVHLVVANLCSMFHRSLEAPFTARVLSAIFADPARFAVHEPLPAGEYFSDEGAANQIRLATRAGSLHLLAWGRSAFGDAPAPRLHPARQTRQASEALARLLALDPARVLFPEQDPAGIDGGAFHTDVLAVGNANLLIAHERAFCDVDRVIDQLRERLGPELFIAVAREGELSLDDAVGSYVFNSELVTLPNGRMALIAPSEADSTPAARRFLDRVVAEPNPVEALHFVDVNASMKNGGGPACLRLAVPLEAEEERALSGRVLFDDELGDELEAWISRHYRDRLAAKDLTDPELAAESRRALVELDNILSLPVLGAC